MHFTLDQRVFENRVLPVHCYSLVMVSFLLKLYFFFLTSDVISCQRMLFWWIGKQNTSDEMYCIINLFTPQLHMKIPRIKEMITNYRHSWLLGKLSLSAFRGMFRDQYSVRREWPSGQSAGLWVGQPGFESWMGHYVVALSKSLHSPCFVFSDKTLSRRSRLLQGLG